jgi:hypothetical protein
VARQHYIPQKPATNRQQKQKSHRPSDNGFFKISGVPTGIYKAGMLTAPEYLMWWQRYTRYVEAQMPRTERALAVLRYQRFFAPHAGAHSNQHKTV